MESSLRSIKLAAEAATHLTAHLVTPSKASAMTSVEIPPLHLLTAPELLPQFNELGFSREIISEITQAFDAATAEAREVCAAKFEQSCRQLLNTECPSGCPPLPHLFERLRRLFQDTYDRTLKSWSTECIPPLLTRFGSSGSTPPNNDLQPLRHDLTAQRKPFNYEYVPSLEKYFAYNPFPSQVDKSILATRSCMTYRQIDVWFQNRRSRAKREGRVLEKLKHHEESRIATQLFGVGKSAGAAVSPPDHKASEYKRPQGHDEQASPLAGSYQLNLEHRDALIIPSPPHAFPSAFPPICGYDPFPVKSGDYVFPPPVWLRIPAKSAERRGSDDVDGLIQSFAKMNLRNGPRKQEDPRKPTVPKRSRRHSDCSSTTCFTTTRPLPAPIPAFIRSRTSSPLQALPIATPRASPTPPAPSSPSSSTLSDAPAQPHYRQRKAIPLRRRGHRQSGHITPAISASHPMPSSPRSRHSSYPSQYSPCTRRSSDISSASSVVVTPEFSSTPLPDHLSPPAITEDFSSLHGILSDPSSGRLSPVYTAFDSIYYHQMVSK